MRLRDDGRKFYLARRFVHMIGMSVTQHRNVRSQDARCKMVHAKHSGKYVKSKSHWLTHPVCAGNLPVDHPKLYLMGKIETSNDCLPIRLFVRGDCYGCCFQAKIERFRCFDAKLQPIVPSHASFRRSQRSMWHSQSGRQATRPIQSTSNANNQPNAPICG